MQEGKHKEALELCTEDNCRRNIAIQRQKISILFELKQYEEVILECDKVLAIVEDAGFAKSRLIAISNLIKKLMQKGKYKEALELCMDEICQQDIVIQGQKLIAISNLIKKLMQKGKYKEALELCTEDNCRRNIAIQGQKISILFELKQHEKIIIECDKAYSMFKDDGFAKSKIIAISNLIKKLMQKGKYKEALELCMDENCRQDIVILNQRKVILSKLDNNLEVSKYLTKIYYNNLGVNKYLTKIYYDDLEECDLNNLSLDKWENLIIYVAYYEKYNKKKGLKFLKQFLIQMHLIPSEKKIINRLKERLISNRNTIFDINVYCEILNCSIDWNYVPSNKQEENIVNDDSNDSYFDIILEQIYNLVRQNKINELKTLLKDYLANTHHSKLEDTIMRLVDKVLQNLVIEQDEYEWNKNLAILTDTLADLYLISNKKAEYYLEQKLKNQYLNEPNKAYKYSKINDIDIEYNYNIPDIEQYIKEVKNNNFNMASLDAYSVDYPYILSILTRELFKMNEKEKGEELLNIAKNISSKINDKELKYFIKAINCQKDILPFKEVISFDEEIRRILKIDN